MSEKNYVTFLWKIENFIHCIQKKGHSLESPEFYVKSFAESVWKFIIYPRGKGTSNIGFHTITSNIDDRIQVCLHNCSFKGNGVLSIDFELSFLSGDGSNLVTGKSENYEIKSGHSCVAYIFPSLDKIIERMDEFLPQNTLSIQCRIWNLRNSLTHSMNYFARTRIGVQQRSFHWKVAEFSKMKINQMKKVHRFIMGKNQPTFFTEVSFKRVDFLQATIQFDIQLITKNVPKLFAICKISVLDVSGKIVKSMEGSHWFLNHNEDYWGDDPEDSIWHFPQFLTTNEVKAMANCVVGDSLNFLFDLTFSNGIMYSNIERISYVPVGEKNSPASATSVGDIAQSISFYKSRKCDSDELLDSLPMSLLSLYMDSTLSDLELRAGNGSAKVHKSILAARSPVFKAMFTSGMKEEADNFLDIPDMDAETLDKFLIFIYTDAIEKLDWTSASKLYYAADKYDICSLKKKCSTFLSNSIVNSNVCEVLILADQYNDEGLLSSVHDFIESHDKEIIRSARWKQFLIDNTALAAETLQVMYTRSWTGSGAGSN